MSKAFDEISAGLDITIVIPGEGWEAVVHKLNADPEWAGNKYAMIA